MQKPENCSKRLYYTTMAINTIKASEYALNICCKIKLLLEILGKDLINID